MVVPEIYCRMFNNYLNSTRVKILAAAAWGEVPSLPPPPGQISSFSPSISLSFPLFFQIVAAVLSLSRVSWSPLYFLPITTSGGVQSSLRLGAEGGRRCWVWSLMAQWVFDLPLVGRSFGFLLAQWQCLGLTTPFRAWNRGRSCSCFCGVVAGWSLGWWRAVVWRAWRCIIGVCSFANLCFCRFFFCFKIDWRR